MTSQPERPPAPATEAAHPQIEPREYLRTIGVAMVIGIPAALVAAVFLQIVHWLEHWLWTDLPESMNTDGPPAWLIVLLPLVGGLLVALARAVLPGDGGHPPIQGIGGGVTPVEYAPGIALAALAGLAFGAVIGPEAPLIALGSVTGVAGARLFRARATATALTASAGSFSAVSAVFGGPLVASMLLLEGGAALGGSLVAALLPGLASACVGYLIFEGLGHWSGLQAAALDVPGLPAYDGVQVSDLASAVLVGVATAVAIQAIRLLALRTLKVSRPHGLWIPLGLGGLATGLLAALGVALGADYSEILFSGQSAVPVLVTETSAAVLLVILLTKALAYAVALGCGFRGGPVFPAIALGLTLAMFPVLWWGSSPTVAVAIGAAAGMAAMTRLPFSGVLFGTLLVGTGNLDVVPVAGLAAVFAWLVTVAMRQRFEPETAVGAQAAAAA
jgi:H+/Cl- antiporter ClcA